MNATLLMVSYHLKKPLEIVAETLKKTTLHLFYYPANNETKMYAAQFEFDLWLRDPMKRLFIFLIPLVFDINSYFPAFKLPHRQSNYNSSRQYPCKFQVRNYLYDWIDQYFFKLLQFVMLLKTFKNSKKFSTRILYSHAVVTI